MHKRIRPCILVLTLFSLSACSLFGSDEESKARQPKPLSHITASVAVHKIWSKQIGRGSRGEYAVLQPLLLGSNIYALDVNGTLQALNSATGQLLWQQRLGSETFAGPGGADNRLYIGTKKGELISVNATTGQELWRHNLSGEPLVAPATDGKHVVVLTADQRIVAFDRRGHQLWAQDIDQPALMLFGAAHPFIFDGTVFVAYANGKVRAINVENGNLLWQQTIAKPTGATELERMVDIDAKPQLINNALFVVSYQGNLVALNPLSGEIIWSREMSSYKNIAAGYGDIYLASAKGFVSAIDQSASTVVWRQKALENRQLSAPQVSGNYLVVGDVAGYLHVLSQVDGSLIGRYHVDDAEIRAQPLARANVLYVYSASGTLQALTLTPLSKRPKY